MILKDYIISKKIYRKNVILFKISDKLLYVAKCKVKMRLILIESITVIKYN